jgi:hypothetical protein
MKFVANCSIKLINFKKRIISKLHSFAQRLIKFLEIERSKESSNKIKLMIVFADELSLNLDANSFQSLIDFSAELLVNSRKFETRSNKYQGCSNLSCVFFASQLSWKY